MSNMQAGVSLKCLTIGLCAMAFGMLADMTAHAQTYRVGDVFRDRFTTGSGQGPEMVVLRSGRFTMGSPASEAQRQSREGPQRTIRIGYRFAIGRYEVTFAEWDACVADGGCGGHRPDDRGWGRDQRPVINVSWNDAQAYVEWLNRRTGLTGRPDRYRLPTEAEWEYAARAGTSTAYSFGNDAAQLDSFAWFSGNSTMTQPVGGKLPNAFGLHDMHGNVREWVEDCSADNYSAGQPSNGSSFNGSSLDVHHCLFRVFRGGSHFVGPQSLRSAARDIAFSGRQRDFRSGFRLARTLRR